MAKDNVTSDRNQKNYFVVNEHYRNRFTDDGANRLRTYLGMVEKGQPKIYTAPFAKGDSMDKVLKDWKDVLVSIQDQWPTLWDFEEDLAKKVGPMSVEMPLSERLSDVEHYYDDIHLSSTPVSGAAISAVCQEFSRIRGLRLRSQKATLAKMKKSTSSGNPWQTKKRNVLQDIIPCDAHTMHGPRADTWACIQGVNWGLTAVLGWRGQEGGPKADDVKQRVVWMFPFALNLCELEVYQPLIESAQHCRLVPAWVSNELVDLEVTNLFDTKGKDDLIVCTDFSRFDQHFNPDLQCAAKLILMDLLTDNSVSQYWLRDVFPAKYNIPLALKYDNIRNTVTYFRGTHGMASGSGGTNVDETLAHRALQYEVAIQHGEKLNPHSMCLGDDGILSYPGITVNDVVAAYESHGQECNVSKQYASTQDCVYLRRWHHNQYRVGGVCVGVYSTCRALGRLRYLERFMDPDVWSSEMVALRQLSIIENCKHHPLFTQFIEFCMKRDKYRLGIDIPGFLDNLTQLAKTATEYMPDFLGYTKTLQGQDASGIAEWDVVKYLKSRR